MINWEAVKQWRDELRSGKFRQTKNKLKNKYGYCCLGVYCAAVANIPEHVDGMRRSTFAGKFSVFPKRAMKSLGVGTTLPRIFDERFSTLNDSTNHSFDEIADLLDLAILEHEAGIPDVELIR